MSAASSHRVRVSTPVQYVPSQSRSEQLAEALGCIIAGRPLPAHLAPRPLDLPAVSSVSEGVGRILRGG